jgi:hypothetical protein
MRVVQVTFGTLPTTRDILTPAETVNFFPGVGWDGANLSVCSVSDSGRLATVTIDVLLFEEFGSVVPGELTDASIR